MQETKKNSSQELGCFLTIAEVRQYLNISLSAAYELSRSKGFPVSRFGGSIRIPRDAFLCWVEKRTYIPTNLADHISR